MVVVGKDDNVGGTTQAKQDPNVRLDRKDQRRIRLLLTAIVLLATAHAMGRLSMLLTVNYRATTSLA